MGNSHILKIDIRDLSASSQEDLVLVLVLVLVLAPDFVLTPDLVLAPD